MNNDYIFKVRTDGDIVDLEGRVIGHINLEYIKSIAENPQDDWFEHIAPGLLRSRHGDYVLYKIDYLYKHLVQEITLLDSYITGDTNDV